MESLYPKARCWGPLSQPHPFARISHHDLGRLAFVPANILGSQQYIEEMPEMPAGMAMLKLLSTTTTIYI